MTLNFDHAETQLRHASGYANTAKLILIKARHSPNLIQIAKERGIDLDVVNRAERDLEQAQRKIGEVVKQIRSAASESEHATKATEPKPIELTALLPRFTGGLCGGGRFFCQE